MGMNESGHWYDAQGNARHTQQCGPKAKNPTRPTTIADAKKLGLFPSVTSILGIMAKPQLENWKFRQITDYAVSNPPAPDGSEDPEMFFSRAIEGAFRQVQQAADAGSQIHDACEKLVQGLPFDPEEQVFLSELNASFPMRTFTDPVARFFEENGIECVNAERTLVSLQEGYAGRMDLSARTVRGNAVIDYKTRRTNPKYKVEPYDGQPMQIAAYGAVEWEGEPFVGCNLYISTTEPGKIFDCWYTTEQLREEYVAFRHLCALWRHVKGYDPRKSFADPSGSTGYTLEDAKRDGITQ